MTDDPNHPGPARTSAESSPAPSGEPTPLPGDPPVPPPPLRQPVEQVAGEQPWAAWNHAGRDGPTWTTSREPTSDPGGDPTWAAAPPPEPGRPVRGGRFRSFLAGSLVGALVGALVAGGLVYLNDDDEATNAPSMTSSPTGNTRIKGEPTDIQSLLAKVQPAVVSVRTQVPGGVLGGQGGEGAGSGFVISEDGTIVTNAHVVAGAEAISIDFDDGTTREATIVGTDTANDLAVLDVDAEGLPVVELGDSDTLAVGDEVVAIGNALGLEGGPSVTSGIVSATKRSIETTQEGAGTTLENTIQTDAAINRGNSGGPLLNAAGQVVGINTAIADPAFAQNVGFAIAISHALPVIQTLQKGTFLGVQTVTVNPAVARQEGLEVEEGALVAGVEADSPAADAGIQEGDVIVELDGEEIVQNTDVATGVLAHEPGDEVKIVVDRDGDRVELGAVLGSRNGG